MILQSSNRLPQPGDYAQWDETGTRVLCHRRLADGTHCRAVLALLCAGRIFGRPYRLLQFPHDGFIEENGIWRTTTAAKARLAAGRSPRRQTGVGPYRLTPSGEVYVGHCVPEFPAWFRCPHRRCGNKRLLDAAVLDVAGGEEQGAWVAAQLTPSAPNISVALGQAMTGRWD